MLKLNEYVIMHVKSTEKEICRIQAVKSFNNERYGNALDWALRSQDNIYVTSIADHFLRVSLPYSFLFRSKSYLLFNHIVSFILGRITQKQARSYVKMCFRILARKCSSHHGLCSWLSTTISRATIDVNNFHRQPNCLSI